MARKALRKPFERVAHVPPKERVELKKLLAINPNYFGTLAKSKLKPVKMMVGNTTYEALTCVGFNPALDLLEATVHIKRPGGYNGALCGPGSAEYVRFFVDYGAGWIDAGLASFSAHDIPNTLDCDDEPDKPLSYVVTLPLVPERDSCRRPVLPNVRAILSWTLVPTAGDPDWPPIWGNVVEQHIQIKPRRLWLGDLVEYISKESLKLLPPLPEPSTPFPGPLPDPEPLALGALAELYRAKGRSAGAVVPPHRFGFAHLQALAASADQEKLSAAAADWKAAGIDLGATFTMLDKTKADVSYEELECLGLEYNLERLVATFRVKQKNGYSGALCGPGSKEYVAFWADWDDTCEWTYLGTTTVDVHDISSIPADGLAYSAILPVDLNAIRRPCGGPGGGPKIGRIRAVLSWATPPSTSDPDALTHWGNRLDAHVQIRPGVPVAANTPTISVIGGIGVADINVFGDGLTKPYATFALGGSPADPWLLYRECPFGGVVRVQAPPVLGFQYRLWVRKFADATTEQIVKSSFHVVNWLGIGSWITPNPTTGYVAYMDPLSNLNQVLGEWGSFGDEIWQMRIEMATMGGTVVGSTLWHNIQLDNTGPRPRPAIPPYEPPAVTCEIHIDSGGDCKDFKKGTVIQGHFVARDTYFGAFSLGVLPTSISPNPATTTTPSTSQTASFAAGGDAWELDTTGMRPCGYVVVLTVSDRSIVGSGPFSHNSASYDVGFCLRE